MATILNESEVESQPVGTSATRQALITAERMPGTSILLDRWTLQRGGRLEVIVPSGSAAWFHVLEGKTRLQLEGREETLDNAHAVFLAENTRAVLQSDDGASVLHVEVPDAGRFGDGEPGAATSRILDWTKEPLLDSKHDSRQRVYMATPKLFGTRAMKCELIVYPPKTSGSKHLHEGAEHFKYVLSGAGTGFADDQPHSLKAGDVVYHPAGEWHFSRTEESESVRFIEFFVPGVFTTVWAGERVCAWTPTGKTIDGRTPVREIAAHAGNQSTPEDV